MASLNLLNWRQRTWYQQLWHYRKGYLLLVSVIGLLLLTMVTSFQPLLTELRRQNQRYAQQLVTLPSTITAHRQYQQQQEQRQHRQRLHQQQAAVIEELLALTQSPLPSLHLSAIRWLPDELVIEGRYQRAAPLKDYVKTLREHYPEHRINVRLPREKHFSLDIIPRD